MDLTMQTERKEPIGIKDAFPNLLSRSVPSIDPTDETLKAIHLLISNRLDVLPIKAARGATNLPRGISGYSIISHLVQDTKSELQRFVSEQCSNSALTLGTISYENDDVQSLLHIFEATSSGYAFLKESDSTAKIISMADLLSLYDKGIFSSELKVKDVASAPVFALSRNTTLVQTLSEMMRRKIRRAKIEDSRWELITDREILEFVFQVPWNEGGGASWVVDQLKRPISDIKLETAPWVHEHLSLGEAAGLLLRSSRACALSRAGIITPWDLIIKPWRLGILRIRRAGRFSEAPPSG
jgi:CBS domain-containing protein